MGSNVAKLFTELDLDDNHYLDREEVCNLADAMQFKPGVDELLQRIDTDKDGKVCLRELKTYLSKKDPMNEKEMGEMRDRLKKILKAKTSGEKKGEEGAREVTNDPGTEAAPSDNAIDGTTTEEGQGRPASGAKQEVERATLGEVGAGTEGDNKASGNVENEEEASEDGDTIDLDSFLGGSSSPVGNEGPEEKGSSRSRTSMPEEKAKVQAVKATRSESVPGPKKVKAEEIDIAESSNKGARTSYSVGDHVHVWSVKRKRWFDNGIVDAVREDGSVHVRYHRGTFTRGNKWIAQSQQSLMLKPQEKQEPPKAGGGDKHESEQKISQASIGSSSNSPPPAPQTAAPAVPSAKGSGQAPPSATGQAPPSAKGQAEQSTGVVRPAIKEAPDHMKALRRIQDSLPPDSKINLAKESRQLIYHGPVRRKGFMGSSSGYLFLFNDLILSCQVASSGTVANTFKDAATRIDDKGQHNTQPAPNRPPLKKEEPPKLAIPVAEKAGAGNAPPDIEVGVENRSIVDLREVKETQSHKQLKATVATSSMHNIPGGLKVVVKEVRIPKFIAVYQGAQSGLFGKSFDHGFTIQKSTIMDPPTELQTPQSDNSDIQLGVEGDQKDETTWCQAIATAAYMQLNAEHGGKIKAPKQQQQQHGGNGKEQEEDRKEGGAGKTEKEQAGKGEEVQITPQIRSLRRAMRKYAWATQLWNGTLHSMALRGDAQGLAKLVASGMAKTLEQEELSEGATPIIIASAYGHADVIRECIKAKADVEATDRSGRTSLSMAVALRRLDIVKILLEAGASPNRPLLDGSSILFSEVIRKPPPVDDGNGSKKEWIDLLVKHGALPLSGEMDSFGNNIVHKAVQASSWGNSALPFLAKSCPRAVRKRNKDGETPLHLAAKEGKSESCKILLSYGAHPNARHSSNWRTALHYARTPDVAVALIMGGGRRDLVDRRGDTADAKIMSHKRFKNRTAKLNNATDFWNKISDMPPASDLRSESKAHEKENREEPVQCVFCWEKFSMIRWKYECARCALPLCSNCSSKSVTKPAETEEIPASKQRVCDGCYNLCRVRAYGLQRAWKIRSVYDEKRDRLGLNDNEQDGHEGAARGGAKEGIQGTKNIMTENLNAVKERGEKLNQMQDKTADLADDAKDYANTAKALRRKFQKQAAWPFG